MGIARITTDIKKTFTNSNKPNNQGIKEIKHGYSTFGIYYTARKNVACKDY